MKMNKDIVISEADITKRFNEMCAESLPPDMYSYLETVILPQLYNTRQALKTNPQIIKSLGMYGETPQIKIGKFIICEQTLPAGDSVWIQEAEKDGGVFPKAKVETALEDFYNKNL